MTPSESIMSRACEEKSILDELGRRLTVKRLNALDTLRLFKAAGPSLSQNQAWLGMASIASSVVAINGIPFAVPSTETQIEAAVSRLGEEGLAAAASAFEDVSQAGVDNIVEQAGNS